MTSFCIFQHSLYKQDDQHDLASMTSLKGRRRTNYATPPRKAKKHDARLSISSHFIAVITQFWTLFCWTLGAQAEHDALAISQVVAAVEELGDHNLPMLWFGMPIFRMVLSQLGYAWMNRAISHIAANGPSSREAEHMFHCGRVGGILILPFGSKASNVDYRRIQRLAFPSLDEIFSSVPCTSPDFLSPSNSHTRCNLSCLSL